MDRPAAPDDPVFCSAHRELHHLEGIEVLHDAADVGIAQHRDAGAVLYKSKAEFTGKDNVVIDVDYKTGTVKRFNYKITVR